MAGKYSNMWKEKKAETSDESSSGGSYYQKYEWFYPNKVVKASEDGTYFVRVLPIEGKSTWYYELNKHSFKAQGTWKNGICLNTPGPDGKPIGDCPICKFLAHNEEEIKGNENYKSVRAKSVYAVLVYDYNEKKIKRLELNYYGFMDVLEAIMKVKDDSFEESIDTEGFNLHYAKDDNGWAKISGVNASKKTIKSIKESLGIEEFPDIEKLNLPTNVQATEKFLDGLLKIIKDTRMFPEIAGSSSSSSKKIVMVDDEDEIPSKLSKDIEDDDDEEEEVVVKPAKEEKKPKANTTVTDEELDDLLAGLEED